MSKTSITKSLIVKFVTEGDNEKSITISNPKNNITKSDITTAGETIVANGTAFFDKITALTHAEYIQRTTTELYDINDENED